MRKQRLVSAAWFAIFIAVSARRAAAQTRWRSLSKNSNYSLFLDTTSVAIKPEGLLVWTKMELPKTATTGSKKNKLAYESITSQWLIDCNARRFKVVRQVMYSADGQAIDESDNSDDIASLKWQTSVPETSSEEMVLGVCADYRGHAGHG